MADPRSPRSPGVAAPPATTMASTLDYRALHNAAAFVDTRLTLDKAYKDLYELLTASSSMDYQQSKGLVRQRTFVLPEALLEQFNVVECKCFLGLFLEINRAWMTIDNRLFLWSFMDGADFVTFDELDQVIVSVSLAKPKPGVFISDVRHLLVIATPIEIVLLGVGLAPVRGGLTLYPTQLTVPSDNINMLCAVGTSTGRIFLGGRDGHLRELVYQAEEGWFTRRCRLVNHTQSIVSLFVPTFWTFSPDDPIVAVAVDDVRNILYTLSERNVIQVFFLGDKGDSLTLCTQRKDIREDVQRQQAQGIDSTTFKILSLHPLTPAESSRIHLVAVTSTGLRLYFSTESSTPSYGSGGSTSSGSASSMSTTTATRTSAKLVPTALQLVHVRAPPVPSTKVHSAFYHNTMFLYANAATDDQDAIISTAPDVATMGKNAAARVRPALFETRSDERIVGRTWTISERQGNASSIQDVGDRYKLNELAMQHECPPREFFCLTSNGLHVLSRVRPIDQLRTLLAESNNQITPSLRSFYDHFSRDECCAMSLVLACQTGRTGVDIDPTTRASPIRMLGDHPVSRSATYVFFSMGGEPTMTSTTTRFEDVNLGRPVAMPETVYSSKHNGLYMYFARIVRPIWKAFVADVGAALVSPRPITPHPLANAVATTFELLAGLRQFLESNEHFTAAPRPADPAGPPRLLAQTDAQQARLLADAQRIEQQSLYSLRMLLVHAIEALALLAVLSDHKLPELIKKLTSAEQLSLKTLTFEKLATTADGLELAKNLLNNLMQEQISAGRTVDALSGVLRSRCPSFLSGDEVVLIKATEFLQSARESSIMQEREGLLRESLRMLKQVVAIITPERLSSICKEYALMRFHPAAIELALSCAQNADPTGLALQFLSDGSPAGDVRAPYLQRRLECYDLVITHVLNDLLVRAKNNTTSTSTPADSAALSKEELGRLQAITYQRALSSQDELFHNAFYDWLVQSNQVTSVLLDIQSPFLEKYLERKMVDTRGPQLDLLWKYYIKNEQFAKAALTLANLASSTIMPITFNQRFDYLTRAVTAARSCNNIGSNTINPETVGELEAMLQVATVQRYILQDMTQYDRHYAAQIEKLEKQLFNITDLYNNFTKGTNLNVCNLAIFHTSGYHNEALVRDLWSRIIAAERDVNSLSSKLLDLAKRFYPSDVVFPLRVVCNLIERFSYQSNTPLERVDWSINTLHQAGVPMSTLFDVYRELSEMREWREPDEFVHLVTALKDLIELWLRRIPSTQASQYYDPRERFSANAVEITISKCITVAEKIRTPGADLLRQQLESLKNRINKAF